MNIDTEKLETNRAYWNMVAPEGAEFYFCMADDELISLKPFFAKTANWSDFAMSSFKGGWEGVKMDGEKYHVFQDIWKKVDKPAEAEKHTTIDEVPNLFYQAIGWTMAQCCIWLDEGKDPRTEECSQLVEMANQDFGIKSRKDLEKDELLKVMGKFTPEGILTARDYRGFADAILSEYNLEKK